MRNKLPPPISNRRHISCLSAVKKEICIFGMMLKYHFAIFVGFQGESLSSKMVSGIPQKYSVRLSGCECCAIAVVNFWISD